MLKLFAWRRSIPTNCSRPYLLISRFLSERPSPSSQDHQQSEILKEKRPKTTSQAHATNSDGAGENSELPFDFMYSYSESSQGAKPIGFREPPKFSPFGPGRIDREWNGVCAPAKHKLDADKLTEEKEKILGDPLSDEEIAELVDKYRHSDCSRQINLGKGGVTHNSLEDIHNHWKRAEAVRIKCLGVPTLDMDNICFHLEDKSGGKIIYRHINILLLYRGRNYDPRKRPQLPTMLWKPYPPLYPKLVKKVADGLTFVQTQEKRNRGLASPPLMKLTRNGVYVNVVERVRTAFETEDVVRIWFLVFLSCSKMSKLYSGKGNEKNRGAFKPK
ncbi:RNA-binding CRS1 / YhbY (CRM) domain-containing protein [Striga asiatica]|uniref:RNA-binding CRS1 / YhbY (CRM) domain-containing protein n=1 Tax=Striga asiatica TaxID=4170 RepID=A0A5A7RDE3_STRAF|nr:RNA-binding CRS1 / YhbY (CRM) domain-containing protein [Striga asiatica]